MSEQSLKQKTVGALFWSLLDRIGQQVLMFVVQIVVANILSREDYGLVGMLAIFTAIGTILIDSGFSSALIQKKQVLEKDLNSVFWFNLGISLIIYLILIAASPYIALYFEQPMLTQLSIVIFLAIPINSLAIIQSTILNKEIRFKALTKVNLIAMSISGVVSLIMALTGCGVWTLALQPVILAASRTFMLWLESSWRPSRQFSTDSIRNLFGFASNLLLANLINTCFLNIYSVIIGKIYPLVQMSYYTQGNKLCDMGVSTLYGSIQNATYPIFSSIQNDYERLIRSFRKTIRLTSFLTFPTLTGLIVIAPSAIRILLKEDWWPTIPIFQWLCLAGCFTILTAINNNFIKVSGHSGGILKLEYFKVIITIGVVLLTFRYSIEIMVIGIVVTRFLIYLINTSYTARFTGYSFGKQWSDTYPYVLLSLVMGACIYPLSLMIHTHWLLLILQIIIGAAIYIALAHFSGSKIFKESLELINKRNKKS